MAKRRKRGVRGAGTIVQTGTSSWALRYVVDGVKVMRAGLTELEAQAAQGRLKRGLPAFVEAGVTQDESRTIGSVLPEFWAWRTERGLKSVRDDVNRWAHLSTLNVLELTAVGDEQIKGVVKAMQRKKLSPASIGLVLNLLSSLYKFARVANPVKGYKVDHKRVLTSQHNPDDTPFLADLAKSQALMAELEKHHPAFAIAYAISRWAGLRPGEVRALEWTDVDLTKSTIKVRRAVRQGRVGTPKSGKGRAVPIGATLVETLRQWRAKNPSDVLVCPALPRKPSSRSTRTNVVSIRNWSPYLNEAQLNTALEAALAALKLEPMTFYQVGRHSFASAWVLSGRDIYKLSKIMGHSSVTVTERYAHLAGDEEALEAA